MFNVGVGEMMVVLVVALLVFGPNRLPEIARSMGKFLRNFQQETNRALNDLKEGIEPVTSGIFDEPDPGTPDHPAEQAAAPAAAFGAAPAKATTRRKTSTRPASTRSQAPARRKASAAAKKKSPAAKKAPAKKKKS